MTFRTSYTCHIESIMYQEFKSLTHGNNKQVFDCLFLCWGRGEGGGRVVEFVTI